MPAEARIFYPFHPYKDRIFKVLQRSGGRSNLVSLELSAGKAFTVPLWMIQPEAAKFCVVDGPAIPSTAYLEVVELISVYCSAYKAPTDTLEQRNGATQL